MTLLPIVDRELRVAARQAKTYRARVAAAAVFLFLLAWMLWLTPWRSRFSSRHVFEIMAWVAFWWCLLAGLLRTADSVSQEKRENTLGLLFLTDLKGYDIVLGKLFSSSLSGFLGLLGIFPVLAIPMLLGGVSLAEFGRVTISLTNTMLVSLAVGLFVSALGRDSRRTALLAGLILAQFSFVLLGIAEVLRYYYQAPAWADSVRLFSMMNTHERALGTVVWTRRDYFWPTLLATHLTGQTFLLLSCLMLPHVWQEMARQRAEFFWKRGWQHVRRWNLGQTAAGKLFRRRALERNPFFWLMSRERICSLGLLLSVLSILSVGLWFFWQYVAPKMSGRFGGFEAFLVGWIFFTGGTHALLLVQIAALASHRLAEDRGSGALELILSTPLTVGRILRGHALAMLRHTGGMMLAVLFIHFILLWAVLTMIGLEDRPSAKAGELLQTIWRVFWHQSKELDWHVPFIFSIPLAALVLFVAHWITLGAVAAWIGLRVKHARNAPWIALPLVLLPPWPFFLIAVMWLNETPFLLGEREALYFGLTLALSLNLGHDLLLWLWANHKLRRDFRLVASPVFHQQKMGLPWFLRRKFLLRLATASGVLVLLTLSFYQFERWRGDRAWQQVLREVELRGESLRYETMLPASVPAAENFFAAPIFGSWLEYLEDPQGHAWREPPEMQLLRSVTERGQTGGFFPGNNPLNLGNWQTRQTRIDLVSWQKFYRAQKGFPKTDEAQNPAADVLLALTCFQDELDELQSASRRPFAVYRVAPGWQGHNIHGNLFWNLTSVLRLRATALVAVGRTDEAIQDIRLILYLADALRNEPAASALQSRAGIVMQAIQPIWEGLVEHCWTERDLAALQNLLGDVDLLGAYSPAIRGETLLQIQRWEGFLSLDPTIMSPYPGRHSPGFFVAAQLYPSGWIQQRKAKLYHQMQDHLLSLVDTERRCVLETAQSFDDRTSTIVGPPAPRVATRFGARGLVESLAWGQNSIDLARVACALERHYLAHGRYPERLEALTPVWLDRMPTDVINGELLQYQPKPDRRFVLYSVGWNRRDDGGAARNSLDWVWSWPSQ